MNKQRFRILFNRARGLLMVVAETAKACGKNTGDRRAFSHGDTTRTMAFALKTTTAVMGLMLGWIVAPAQAAGIVADPYAPASQRPSVLNAGNGVPLVNIQTPSAAGVSRNTYTQFDVGPQGAMLNNSHANVKTQLGGYIPPRKPSSPANITALNWMNSS